MTRDEAVAELASRFGNRTDIDAVIINCLQAAQRRLERDPWLPWFLISEIVCGTTTPDSEVVVVPPGFLRSVEEGAFWIKVDSENWVEMIKKPYDWIKGQYTSTVSVEDYPKYYSLMNNKFRIGPVSSLAWPIKFVYYRAATRLTGNFTNAWLENAPDYLMAMAGVLVASHMNYPEKAAEFKEEAAEQRLLLLTFDTARDAANQDLRQEYVP